MKIAKHAMENERKREMEKRPLIIITGPTAVGKTELSIKLSKAVGGEIISADSMQVYRHMDIGSAKVTKEEMDGVPHHLIDVLEPWEDFNVVVFQQMANKALEGIYARGAVPIIAGGTGFYIQALLYSVDFKENPEGRQIREELEALVREKGAEYLHQCLDRVDPESAAAIHSHNVKRVIGRRGRKFRCITRRNGRKNPRFLLPIMSYPWIEAGCMSGLTSGSIRCLHTVWWKKWRGLKQWAATGGWFLCRGWAIRKSWIIWTENVRWKKRYIS